MMSDSELAIINAAKENFPEKRINTCIIPAPSNVPKNSEAGLAGCIQ